MRVRTSKGMFVAATFVFAFAQCIESEAAAPGAVVKVAPTRGFLTPISSSLFLAADDPRVVRACGTSRDGVFCPKFLRYGGGVNGGGPGPFIPPIFKAEARNILVTFTLNDVDNVWVSHHGIDSAIHNEIDLFFAVDSTVSSAESPPGPSGNPPDPGPYTHVEDIQTSPGTTTHFNMVIWQALITDGCVSPPVIPIDFLSTAGEFAEPSPFHAMDNTSLTSTGFWNFRYTIRVTDIHHDSPRDERDRSDFVFRGKVSVICTGLEEL